MSAYGFADLTDESLTRLIASYKEGLARIDSGQTKYACGGSSRRQIATWLKQAQAEQENRS